MKLDQPNQVSEESSLERVKKKTLFERFEEIKEEQKRVSWTSREELWFSTKLVVFSTFSFGFGIYCVDLLVKGLLDSVATIVHLVVG